VGMSADGRKGSVNSWRYDRVSHLTSDIKEIVRVVSATQTQLKHGLKKHALYLVDKYST